MGSESDSGVRLSTRIDWSVGVTPFAQRFSLRRLFASSLLMMVRNPQVLPDPDGYLKHRPRRPTAFAGRERLPQRLDLRRRENVVAPDALYPQDPRVLPQRRLCDAEEPGCLWCREVSHLSTSVVSKGPAAFSSGERMSDYALTDFF
jgi:hypothetical protein